MKGIWVYLFLVSFTPTKTFQQEQLSGRWKCVAIESKNSLFSEDLKEMAKSTTQDDHINRKNNNGKYKWAIDFNEDGTAEYEPCFKCEKKNVTYQIENSILTINGESFKVDKCTKDSLIITFERASHILVPVEKH